MDTNLHHLMPEYDEHHHGQTPYSGLPHHGTPPLEYGPPTHHGPLNYVPLYYDHLSYGPSQPGPFPHGPPLHEPPPIFMTPPLLSEVPVTGHYNHFHYQDGDSEEEDDLDEDESVVMNSLEEALQEVNIQLPRLAVNAPASVLPPKGQGVCKLPNLGNTCYLNVVLQCLYHTPGLPTTLAQACEGLDKGKNSVAQALSNVMTKMDDVRKVKKGVLAFFKGVCGLRDEQFAGENQQEAHDLLSGLLLWLHQDLSSKDEVQCACSKGTKAKKKPKSTTTTTTTPPATRHHYNNHQSQTQENEYQYRPPGNPSYPPYQNLQPPPTTINPHPYHHSIPPEQHEYDLNPNPPNPYYQHQDYHTTPIDHYQEYSGPQTTTNNTSSTTTKDQELLRSITTSSTPVEGKVCERCGVTYQRRSVVSDLFEGIKQQDIICPKEGIILNTTWERFTSLSLPISEAKELTLEEALQKYFRVCTFMWDCDYCRTSHQCHQQTRILCAPPILILHLSRLTTRRNPKKQSVTFPFDGLKLDEHMKAKGKVHKHDNYDLYGICHHHGTMQEGHYYACCRVSRGQQDVAGGWYEFDDEEVGQVKHPRHPREAHILFYCMHSYQAKHL